jgi:HlyD family secretion protein
MSQNPLFRDAALKRLSSPEALDESLHVVPPRAWLALLAAGALLAALVTWSFFGRIPIAVTGQGVFVSDREATIFLSVGESRRVTTTMPAHVTIRADASTPSRALHGVVKQIASESATRAELAATSGNEASLPREPRIALTLTVPDAAEIRGTPCTVRIVVGERRPVSLLTGR